MSLLDDENIRYSGTQTNDEDRDVLDSIVDYSPAETSTLSLASRGPRILNPIQIEAQMDYTARPTVGLMAAGEGDDYSFSSTATRVFLKNRTGINKKSVAVSGSHMASSIVGITDPLEYEAYKVGRDLIVQLNVDVVQQAIDIDSFGPNSGSIGNKRKAGGLEDQIIEHAAGNTTYVLSGTVATNARSVNTSAATLTSSDIEDALITNTNNGGNPNKSKIMSGTLASLKLVRNLYSPVPASNLVLYRRDFGRMDQRAVDLTIDVIETMGGTIYLVPDQDFDASSLVMWDPEFFQIRLLRDVQFSRAPEGLGDWSGTTGLVEYSTMLTAPATAIRLHTLS